MAYIKNNSEGIGENQMITTSYLLGRILPNLRNKKHEHLNWVGLVDNLFTEEATPYVLIFSEGSWDAEQIVNQLIEDIVDPWSDDENFPSPFSDIYTGDRAEFISKLKGAQIY